MTKSTISRQHVSENQRIQHTTDLFGIRFPLNIEPAVYSIAGSIAFDEYSSEKSHLELFQKSHIQLLRMIHKEIQMSPINWEKDIAL